MANKNTIGRKCGNFDCCQNWSSGLVTPYNNQEATAWGLSKAMKGTLLHFWSDQGNHHPLPLGMQHATWHRAWFILVTEKCRIFAMIQANGCRRWWWLRAKSCNFFWAAYTTARKTIATFNHGITILWVFVVMSLYPFPSDVNNKGSKMPIRQIHLPIGNIRTGSQNHT